MPVIQLTDVKIGGFATENVEKDKTFQMLIRASLTSDQQEFYVYMEGVERLLSSRAMATGTPLFFSNINALLVVIHPDNSAELHLQDFSMVVEMLAKRDVKAGEAVSMSKIADIRRVRFPDIEIKEDDKIFVCFKVGWKFALLFDFGENRKLDIDYVETSLGNLYRTLSFQDIYEALSSADLFDQIVAAGWFPFVEVIGGEFENLLRAHNSQFNIDGEEKKLLARFGTERIEGLAERWWKHSILGTRRIILEPALDAFKRNDAVSCLKNILTEIEGIIREAHIADLGTSASIKDLLEYAAEKGVKKTGSETSLLFPRQFLQYLSDHTFAHFDPMNPNEDILSRHSVGHGGAAANAYTQVRALQAILTLDQIRFYL